MGVQENNASENTVNDVGDSYKKVADTSKNAIDSGRNIGRNINRHKKESQEHSKDNEDAISNRNNNKDSDNPKQNPKKNSNPITKNGLLNGNANGSAGGRAADPTRLENPLHKSGPAEKLGSKKAKEKIGDGIKKAAKALILNPVVWIISGIAVFVVIVIMTVILLISTMSGGRKSVDISMDGLPPFITEEMVVTLVQMREQYGDPPSVGLAQIIAESGYGKYGPNGESGQGLSGLAYNDKNLFGMKTGSSCTHKSGSVSYSTGEDDGTGNNYQITARFSKYPSYADCITCRSECYIPNGYYPGCISKRNTSMNWTKEDADAYAMGLQPWATSIVYCNKLISLMEQYDLYRFDNMGEEDVGNEVGTGKRDGTFGSPIGGVSVKSLNYSAHTFEWRSTRYHQGCDLAYAGGTPVVASDGGVIAQTGYNSARGNYVVVYHGDGWMTVYQHLSLISVKKEQKVSKGQTLGGVGSTGQSSGPHLHFEIHEGVSETTAKTTIPYSTMNHKGAYTSSARYCEDYLKD